MPRFEADRLYHLIHDNGGTYCGARVNLDDFGADSAWWRELCETFALKDEHRCSSCSKALFQEVQDSAAALLQRIAMLASEEQKSVVELLNDGHCRNCHVPLQGWNSADGWCISCAPDPKE